GSGSWSRRATWWAGPDSSRPWSRLERVGAVHDLAYDRHERVQLQRVVVRIERRRVVVAAEPTCQLERRMVAMRGEQRVHDARAPVRVLDEVLLLEQAVHLDHPVQVVGQE